MIYDLLNALVSCEPPSGFKSPSWRTAVLNQDSETVILQKFAPPIIILTLQAPQPSYMVQMVGIFCTIYNMLCVAILRL